MLRRLQLPLLTPRLQTIAGNIATASPISDLNPIWMCAGAELTLVSELRGERRVRIDDKFFTGYRRTIIEPDEVLKTLYVPLTRRGQFFRAYKVVFKFECCN